MRAEADHCSRHSAKTESRNKEIGVRRCLAFCYASMGENLFGKRRGYQSKTIRGNKYVSYDAQLCPVIAKGHDPGVRQWLGCVIFVTSIMFLILQRS